MCFFIVKLDLKIEFYIKKTKCWQDNLNINNNLLSIKLVLHLFLDLFIFYGKLYKNTYFYNINIRFRYIFYLLLYNIINQVYNTISIFVYYLSQI